MGGGNQFISGSLRDGTVYWAADVSLPEGANRTMQDRKGFLQQVFRTWHDPIPELIELTDNSQLVIADFYDSIPRRLTAGRVALLGDAAHPMTPDLGQGACQGIEDAVVLAACMSTVDDPLSALAKYESLRLRRVRSVVRGSRRLGQLATSTSAVVVGIRSTVSRHMPQRINASIAARIASENAFRRTLHEALGARRRDSAPRVDSPDFSDGSVRRAIRAHRSSLYSPKTEQTWIGPGGERQRDSLLV